MPRHYQHGGMYGGGMFPFGGAALTGLYQGGGWGSPRYGSGSSGGGGDFNRGFRNYFVTSKVAEDNDPVASSVEAEAEDALTGLAAMGTVDHAGMMEIRITGTGRPITSTGMPE
ncbi:hypothetical protein LTR10_012510 [Elasticomyces elasticus]|nr:hypothetical protein LTR10_012510 [Elasticomyces elasticus]KAK4965984.1 hypothetical protein LTR42_011998 [Elasticomyces elasticus]